MSNQRSYGHGLVITDFDTCFYCNEKLGDYNRSKDHVLPQSQGGIKSKDNIVPACDRCQEEKKDLWPEEWMEIMLIYTKRLTRMYEAEMAKAQRIKSNLKKLINSKKK